MKSEGCGNLGSLVVRTQCVHCHGPGVQFLDKELRSHKLLGAAKNKKIKLKKEGHKAILQCVLLFNK